MEYIFLDKINNEVATFTNGTDFWHFLGDWKCAMEERGVESIATKCCVYTVTTTNPTFQEWQDALAK